MHEYTRGIFDELEQINDILPDDVELVWVLPQLLQDKDLSHISEILVKLRFKDIDVKIQTDNIAIADNLDSSCYANYLNIYNNYTIEKLCENNLFERMVVSNEISMGDIKLLQSNEDNLEYIIFGHNQLMISKDNFEDIIDERIDNYYFLKDKRDNKYRLVFDCNNNSHIYDYRIANLEDYINEFENTGISSLSIDLRHFNSTDSKKILDYFCNIINNTDNNKLELSKIDDFYTLNIEKGLYVNKK